MMSYKILIPSLLAITLIGSSFYIAMNKTELAAEEVEYKEVQIFTEPNHDMDDLTHNKCYRMEDTCGCDAYSIWDWAACYRNKVPKCDDAPVHARAGCYKAASQVSDLVYPQARNILNACENFYKYFERTNADQPLNKNNYFSCCFADSRVIQKAQTSSWYYNQIYSKLYLECGHVRVY